MPLRLIARDLYRLLREIARLEQALSDATPADRDELKRCLKKAKLERNAIQRTLDGHLDR